MNTKEIVKELAANRKLTIAEVERKAGISNGTIGKFGKQKPSLDTLNKLADFFGVSVDYLIGREEAKPKQVDINDDTVIMTFSGKELSEEDRALVLATTRAILEQRNKNK